MNNSESSSDIPSARTREEDIVAYIFSLLQSASLPAGDMVPEPFQGIKGLKELAEHIRILRGLAYSLSQGDLSCPCRERGFIAGGLKGLQSNLRNLTWEARQIADGDYSRRVHFMGDFSSAFNRMAERLGGVVNELTCMSEEYKSLARHDALTGLYNRHGFTQSAERMLASDRRRAALIIADLDLFKRVNDTYGHSAGDTVLRNFAALLCSELRANDLCCRYGGEEFVILMPETSLPSAEATAERLRRKTEQAFFVFDGKEVSITASFGVAAVTRKTDESVECCIENAFQRADAMLYKAKNSGRNKVLVG